MFKGRFLYFLIFLSSKIKMTFAMKLAMTSMILCLAIVVQAQTFTRAVDRYSKKKLSYITLNSGEELVGNIKDVDRKKGLIEEIKIELESGEKKTFTPEDIKHAFLPRSGFESFATAYSDAFDATTWGEDSPEGERIKDGYAYFESEEIVIKKKKRILLMQIVNPHFNKSITVYHDPLARETASVGIGGIKVAGGIDKSYYVKKNNGGEPFRLKSKNYKDEYKELFGDCDIKPEDAKRIMWSDFAEHIIIYTKNCSE